MKPSFCDFAENFPGSRVPRELEALFGYASECDEWFSGRFRLVEIPYGDSSCWGDDEELSKQFAAFGGELDGSLYALWLHSELPPERAPVVYLGSEGEGCSVLANNITDFLSLLAVGADHMGSPFSKVDPPAAVSPELARFRLWLKHDLGIEPAHDPADLMDLARSQHPDPQAFLRNRQGEKLEGREIAPLPGEVHEILAALGRPVTDPVVVGLITKAGGRPPRTARSDGYLSIPNGGLQLHFSEACLVDTVFVQGPASSELPHSYVGTLPHNLDLHGSRADVHLVLGPPNRQGTNSLGGAGPRPFDLYFEDGYAMNFEFTLDERAIVMAAFSNWPFRTDARVQV